MKHVIVNLEPRDYSARARQALQKVCEYRVVNSNQPIPYQIADATVIISRLRYELNSELLRHAPNLKFIITATTGLNHVDIEYAKCAGVQVISLQGESKFLKKITPTAEHTWGLLLALVRKYKRAFTSVDRFEWQRDQFEGEVLQNKVLGVIGLGRLGAMVAKYGEAFGMKIIYADIKEHRCKFARVNLDTLLRLSDIITLHVPLNDTTRGLISPREFRAMEKRPYLLNTSRGEVVDEDGLLTALKGGQIRGAALDVLCNEEKWAEMVPKNNALTLYARNNDNLILTPHIGGACPEAMRSTELFVAEKFLKLCGCDKFL